ncbi:MAG: enoyl-CoA hydratase/isomerase family protein, partial [Gammaproteobacteria bacterium]
AMVAEVTHAMGGFSSDAEVLAVIVHGDGRAFSAGFDLKEEPPSTIEATRALLERDLAFILQFWDCPKPVIAAVHGYCLASAFELALACDMTIAAEGTRFGEPEVRFGSGIVALLLPFMTTPKIAKELLLTGNDKMDARRALEIGIVNAVVPEGKHLDAAMTAARAIVAASPTAVQLTKRAINRAYETTGLRQALLAALDIDVLIESSDGAEKAEFNRLRKDKGLQAALEWRNARFHDTHR